MGHVINISTPRMQCIGAYLAEAEGRPRGGLVVVQEIFGVNAHIRSVVDRFAQLGYTAIAPAFFDHVETGVELAYDRSGFARGRHLAGEIPFDLALEDVGSAAESIASAGRIGCVGYCWGGTVAFLAAARLGLPAVSYYGARNVQFLDEPARAPLMFHFGGHDRSIPPDAVAEHREKQPQAQVFVYAEADHAFNRDPDPPYEPASAALAWRRTLDFLAEHLS